MSFVSKYNRFPGVYELGVGFVSKHIWKFPRNAHSLLYRTHAGESLKHLEIGCASVMVPATAPMNKLMTRFDLLDIEATSLLHGKRTMISQGIPQENIQLIEGSVLELNRVSLPQYKYNSIAMSYLLQCIPGRINEKLPVIIDGLASNIDSETVVFGVTICGDQFADTQTDFEINYASLSMDTILNNLAPKITRKVYQKLQQKKVFYNENDNHSDLSAVLDVYFDEYEVQKIGYVSVFVAKRFKK